MRRRQFLRAAGVGAVSLPTAARAPTATATATAPGAAAAATAEPYAPLAVLEVANAREAVVGDDGVTAYVAAGDGFVIVDVSDPAAPQVLAERRDLLADREGGPLRDIQDAAVDGDHLLVVGPAHPRPDALSGAALFDVSDPAAPRLLDFHRTDYPVHNADLADGVAYLTANAADEHALAAVDLGATEGGELARWSVVDAAPEWAEVPLPLRVVHDVTVRGDRAHVAYWDAGTWILDVGDPTAPRAIAEDVAQSAGALAGEDVDVSAEALQLPGNSHYAASAPDSGATSLDLVGVGREAWDLDPDDDRNGGPGGIDLYDRSLASLATVPPPETPDPTRDGVWTTAHNFGFGAERLYSAWYQGGVRIHDLSDPAAPLELAWWRDPAWAFWTAVPAQGCVVAAAFRRGERERGRLYTFPDRAGEQTDPPPLTANATATPSPGTTAGESPPAAETTKTTEAEPPTATATTATTDAGAGTTTAATTESDGVPGLGLGAGLAGLAAGALLRRWRRRRDSG